MCADVTYIISPSLFSLTIASTGRGGAASCSIAGAEREFDGVARGARGGREIARIGADVVCESVAVVLVREIAGAEMESDGCVDHRTDR